MKYALSLVLLLALPAFATIAQQQSAKNFTTCTASGCSIPFPNNPHTGNLFVVWTFWQSTNTFTASVSDSLTPTPSTFVNAVGPTLQPAASTPISAQIFYAKNIQNTANNSDTVSVAFSGTGTITSAGAVIVEYSGADTLNPLDSVSEAISNSAGNTLDSGTVAPANASLLVFGGGTSDTGTPIAGSGFTAIQANGGSLTEQNTNPITANNTFQRATACLGTGALCNTSTGNWTMQMAVFRAATWTGAGGTSSTRAHGILYADQFPGADIGAQINNAVAALLTKGSSSYPYGTIYLSSGPYSFSTPIVINSPYVILNCNGATINYTGSGTGVLFSNSASIYDGVGGIEHCYITGTSSATNVVEFNGNVFGHIWDTHIEAASSITGSPTNCLQVQNTNGFFTEQLDFNELHVQSCTVGILEINNGGTASMAYQRWRHVHIETPTVGGTGVELNGVQWGGGNDIDLSCALGGSMAGASTCLWLTNGSAIVLANLNISGEVESGVGTTQTGIKVDAAGPMNNPPASILQAAWIERWSSLHVTDSFMGKVIPYAWNTPNYAELIKDPNGIVIGYDSNSNVAVTLNTQNLMTYRTQYFQDANGTIALLKMEDCGSTTTCAGTIETNPFLVRGSVTFPTATTVSVGSLPFSNSASYSCAASEVTSPAGIVQATSYTSGSSVTFTETGGTTADTIRYICVGY